MYAAEADRQRLHIQGLAGHHLPGFRSRPREGDHSTGGPKRSHPRRHFRDHRAVQFEQAVWIEHEHRDQGNAADQRKVVIDRGPAVQELAHDASRDQQRPKQRTPDRPDTAGHDDGDDEDAGEHIEVGAGLAHLDRTLQEGEQDATGRGDCRTDHERVTLHPGVVDAQCRRRALVGAYGEQPTTGRTPAYVCYPERQDDEHGERDEGIPVAVEQRVDGPTADMRGGDGETRDTTGVVRVSQYDVIDSSAQAERDDGEGDAAGPQRRQADDAANRRGEQGCDHQGDEEGHMRDEPGRQQGADTGEHGLGEGELTGIAGDEHDGERDDAEARRGGYRDGPCAAAVEHDRRCRDVGNQDRHDADSAGSHSRQPVQDEPAQRKCAAPDQEDRDDDQEWRRGRPARLADIAGEF